MPEAASDRMGYAEERLGPSRYRVRFTAPQRSSVAIVEELARRRSAEITLSKGYRWFAIRDRKVARDVYVLNRRDGTRITYRGGYGQWRRFWRNYCIARGLADCRSDPLWLSRRSGRPRLEVSLDIELLESRQDGVDIVDAVQLLVERHD